MSRVVFPYGIRFREDSRIETFPALEISIVGKFGVGIKALFHIDSGATTSILPAGDAHILKVDPRKGKRLLVRGITGEPIVGYRYMATLDFGARKIKAPVVFVESDNVPRILGREDIFRRFGILFDESGQRTLFLDRRTERKTIGKLFLT